MKTHAGELLSRILAKPPKTAADLLSSNEFTSGGPSAALRVLTVYMAYAGKRLSASRRHSLQRARDLLLERTRHALAEEQ
jgi:hypothetical protein